ncbi:MacS family sensor histidine kinase [Jatrophihabitans sp. YIM 134969]
MTRAAGTGSAGSVPPGRTPTAGAPDVRVSLWRAAAAFRLAALAYLVIVHVRQRDRLEHQGTGVAVLVLAAAVTAVLVALVLTGLPHRPRRIQAAVVTLDAVVTAALTLATVLVQRSSDYGPGNLPTVTTVWAAGPLLEAAVVGGVAWGVVAAVVQFLASVFAHGTGGNDSLGDGTLANGAILVLAGAATGYAASVAERGQDRLVAAAAAEAQVAERERLARDIHDGALQTLALLQRRLREPVPDADRAELAELAGRQEIAMRSLLTSGPAPTTGVGTDLLSRLRPLAGTTVTVSGPATPVVLPAEVVDDVVAAVAAALDNVARHAGEAARAWVFVDDDAADLTVSVRDDGVGTTPARLAEAATGGRIGVAGSVRGRIEALGGRVELCTAPGQGVEVTLHVPRERAGSSP